VRSLIADRSKLSNALTIRIIIRPPGVDVSMFSMIDRKPAPIAVIRLMMRSKSFSECDK
jgi:hypothetical protein